MPSFTLGKSLKKRKDTSSSSFIDSSTPTRTNRPLSTQSTPGVFITHSTPAKATPRDIGNTTEPLYFSSDHLEDPSSPQYSSLRLSNNNSSTIMNTKISPIRNQRRSPSFLNLKRNRSRNGDDLGDESEEEVIDQLADNGSAVSFRYDNNTPIDPGTVKVPLVRVHLTHADTNEDSMTDSDRPSMDGKAVPTHVAVEEHMANAESTVKNDSGIFSTFINAAQNAASTIGNIASSKHEELKPHPPTSNGTDVNNGSPNFMQHLDTLLFNQSGPTKKSNNSQVDLQHLDTDQASISSNPKSSFAHDVVFQPIRKTAISTLGKGQLTLEDLGFTESSKLPSQELLANSAEPKASLGIPSIDVSEPTPVELKPGTVLPLSYGELSPQLTFEEHQIPNSQVTSYFQTSASNSNIPRLALDSTANRSPDIDQSPLRHTASSISSNNFRRSLSPNGTARREPLPTLPIPPEQSSKVVHRRSVSSGNNTLEPSTVATSINGVLTNQISRDADQGIIPSISMNSYNVELKDIHFASEKRNHEFHHLFKTLSRGEKLIDDFSCALQRDILIQGKLYISETHLSFKSNILGWITSFTIPVQEIVQLEKKTTAGLFHNGIVIQTLHQRYVFASFLSRDNTFELILNIWTQLVRGTSNLHNNGLDLDLNLEHLSREQTYDDEDDESDFDDDTDFESDNDADNSFTGPLKHEPTEPIHKENPNEKKVIETTINAPLGKIYQCLFGDDTVVLKRIIEKQKNYKISALTGFEEVDGVKKRSYSYTKPLGGPVGPKETLCEVTETLDHYDLKDYIQVIQNTRSPDVPSGNAFSVYTTIYLSWGPKNSTKILVYTYVDWTGKSWIKSAVEKGTIDGQKESIGILVDVLKSIDHFNSTEKLEQSEEESGGDNLPIVGPKQHPPTENDYKPKQGDTQITEETLHAPLGTVFQLLFGDDTSYMRSIISTQKNFDVTEITAFQGSEGSRIRNYSYTKPLGGAIGPKETRCNITETIEHYDLNKYVQVLQTTATPDVPSGNSFTVHTNFYLSWGSGNSTKVLVITSIIWTGKSWIKSAIEKGTIDGQKESVGILIKELKDIISRAETTGGTKEKRKRSKTKSGTSKREKPNFVEEVLKEKPTYNFLSSLQNSPINSFPLFFVVCLVFWIILRTFAPNSNGVGQKVVIEDVGNVMIGGKEYMIIPSVNQALTDMREYAEFDIWEWINERSGIDYGDDVAHRQQTRKRSTGKNYEDQKLRDVIKLAEERIQKLKLQLDERD